jgi:Domain of unknown function (DUF6531)
LLAGGLRAAFCFRKTVKSEMTTNKPSFWRPPLWKWLVFLALAGCLVLLVPRKPKVELLPFTDSRPSWDGSYPYLVISLDDRDPGQPKFKASVATEKPTLRHDAPVNEFEVDLHTGRFVLRQTDIFDPGAMPLSLTRTYAAWEPMSMAFGGATNHPYDIAPTGTRFPYTYMNLDLEDGRQILFSRISKGTGYEDAVFRHSESSSEFYGAQIAWNGNGWTLTLQDRSQVLFPDSYYAKNYAQGAPTEMQDGDGHRIQLKRDGARNLVQLISLSGRTIAFKYDYLARIIEADDGAGVTRKYSYENGHLKTVSDVAHTLYEFKYEVLVRAAGYDPYLLTSVMDGDGKELLRNSYSEGGRVTMQRLGNGDVYHYDYLLNSKNEVVETIVTMADGTEKRFFFEGGKLVKEK